MQTKNIWIGIVAVIVVLAALIAYVHGTKTSPTSQNSMATTSPSQGNASVGATGTSVIITYSDTGFSPSSLSIAEGTTVTWVNKSSGRLWVASNPHPVHTEYDGTSMSQHCAGGSSTSPQVFDECAFIGQGGSFSFTFAKTGSWGYHNHAQPSDQGSVIVTGQQATSAAANINVNAIPN